MKFPYVTDITKECLDKPCKLPGPWFILLCKVGLAFLVGSGWGKVELRRYKMGLEWGWMSLEKAGVKGLETGVTLQSGGCLRNQQGPGVAQSL